MFYFEGGRPTKAAAGTGGRWSSKDEGRIDFWRSKKLENVGIQNMNIMIS